ncbi:MAG: hypothetical protein DHS20C15_03780 [Planctomycetota bacterium]|nr:MAG: hypothetical protein DHS20C15_03780 [Planctomycetota bacterium]
MALAVLFVDSLSRGEPEARAGGVTPIDSGDELVIEFGLSAEQLPSLSEGIEGVDFHTVREGETLRGIARALFGDPNRDVDLAALNGLTDPDKITVGQRLKLP